MAEKAEDVLGEQRLGGACRHSPGRRGGTCPANMDPHWVSPACWQPDTCSRQEGGLVTGEEKAW